MKERKTFRFDLFVIAMSLLSLGTVPLAGQQPNPGQPPSEEPSVLDVLKTQYTAIHSVHLGATALVTIHQGGHIDSSPGHPITGTIRMEYWAEDDKYRFSFESDPRLGLIPDSTVAYDGEDFQVFLPTENLLRIQTGNRRQLPTLPNPFFLPLQFLGPSPDDCRHCVLRLEDLHDPKTWTGAAASALEHLGPRGAAQTATAEIPYGALGGQASAHRVHAEAGQLNSDSWRVMKIERVVDGRVLGTITLASRNTYKGPGVIADLPRVIELSSLSPDGSVEMESRYVIDDMELNIPIEDSRFTLDRSVADYIWNEDTQVFDKHPSGDSEGISP